MKRILCAAAAAVLTTAAFVPLQASADTVIIRTAPPAPRHEVVPALRHGYVWAPGYWNYNGHRYVWVRGHMERERHGYAYRQPEWHQGAHGWELDRGGWRR
jgi:hypothetical protein